MPISLFSMFWAIICSISVDLLYHSVHDHQKSFGLCYGNVLSTLVGDFIFQSGKDALCLAGLPVMDGIVGCFNLREQAPFNAGIQ